MAEGNGATYSPEIKALGDSIVALTVGKAVELGNYLEQVHGIKPAAGAVAVAAGPVTAAPAEKPPEPTEFQVVLEGLADPTKKIGVIKVVRELTNLGLKEAKDLVEGAPKPVKETVAEGRGQRHQEETGRRRRQGVAQAGVIDCTVKRPGNPGERPAFPAAAASQLRGFFRGGRRTPAVCREFPLAFFVPLWCNRLLLSTFHGDEARRRTGGAVLGRLPRTRNGGQFRCSHGGMQRATSQFSAAPATGSPPGSRPGFLCAPSPRAGPHCTRPTPRPGRPRTSGPPTDES